MKKLKFCQLGSHDVEKLFHREIPGVRQSCCHLHKPRTAIKSTSSVNLSNKYLVERAGEALASIEESRRKIRYHVSKVKPKEESMPDLLKRAEKVFNKWIRNRDTFYDCTFFCMSCYKWKSTKEMDCGHFYPKTYSALRFNEDNCSGQCAECNRSDPNHLIGYKDSLIKKIGLERFEILKSTRHDKVKWDRAALLEIIEKYK